MTKLQEIGEKIVSNSTDDIPSDLIKKFLDILVEITNKNKAASTKVEEATKLVLKELEFSGLDLGNYLNQTQS